MKKSNEIAAVPLLLRQLELAGCLVTVDALNTQKDIAREIKEADADYVLALKGNHPLLYQEVSDLLLDARARGFAGVVHDCYEEADKGHGRLEIRRHWMLRTWAGSLHAPSGRGCGAWAWSSVSGTRFLSLLHRA